MRVLVAAAPFAELTSAQTGAALARAWAELGAHLAVVPVAQAGEGFSQAWADLHDAELVAVDAPSLAEAWRTDDALCLRLEVEPAEDDGASSAVIGRALAVALAGCPVHDVWLEVTGHRWHDGGAGMLAALGATGDRPLDAGVLALAGLGRLELAPVRAALGDARLHLVTTGAQAALQLTGLRGITSVRGYARGDHPGAMLATDEALLGWCAALTASGAPVAGTTDGAGALGGLGAAVLALGGEVVTGPQACVALARVAESLTHCDLLVTGCDELEFGTKGGDVLPVLTDLAGEAMRPVVAVCRRNWISERELRTMGIETAYSLTPVAAVAGSPAPADPGTGRVLTEHEVTELATPAARSWCW